MIKTRSIFLFPFSVIYGFITWVRNFLYNAEILRSTEFSIPVISVGNITVGGTGKTPHTEYITDLLRKNFRVAVLSRGYRRKSSGFRIAGSDSAVSDVGDEPLQMSGKFPDVVVAVDRNRVNGVKEIMKIHPDISVIILDDAFQHRRITPGFSILLSDYERLMIRDHLLPYGNLRESILNMERADVIMITKSPENISPIQRRITVKEISKAPYQNLYFTSIVYKDPLPVFEGSKEQPDLLSHTDSGEKSAVLVTGIVNPGPLAEYLKPSFAEVIHLSFGDHHSFSQKDMEKITTAWNSLKTKLKFIITTEKDSVRLREFTNFAGPFHSSSFYIPIGVRFLNDDKEEFDNLIVNYVRKNKRNNRIS